MKLFFSFASAVRYWRVAHLDGMPRPSTARVSSLATATARAHDIKSFALTGTGLDGTPLHLLVPHSNDQRRTRDITCHIYSHPLPQGAFFALGGNVFLSSPELTFLQMAASSSLIDLIEYGFELCGSYSLLPTSDQSMAMPSLPRAALHDLERAAQKGLTEHEPLTSTKNIAAFLEKMKGAYGLAKAHKALRWVVDGSASPMETRLAMLMCLPPRYGGYGLSRPEMNRRVSITSDTARVDGKGYYLCDIYWNKHRLDVEYDSKVCHDGSRHKVADDMRRNALENLGISVITASARQVMLFDETDRLAHQIAAKMNRKLRKPTPEQIAKRVEFRKQLLDFNRIRP